MGKRLDKIRAAANKIPRSLYREASTEKEFQHVLDEFAENRVEFLVVIAGDGTFHAVVSYLFREKVFQQVPVLCPLPAGTTNMTAYDFGIRGKPEKLLASLATIVAEPDKLILEKRPLLKVEREGAETLYGMFFGSGLIVEGVKFFKHRVKKLGATGEGVSGLVMLRYLVSLLPGSSAYKQRLILMENGEVGSEDDYLLVFVSALHRLLLGMRPYWGNESSPMHMSSIKHSPSSLWLALLPLLIGQGRKLKQQDGYHSRNLDNFELAGAKEFIIDGEIYVLANENIPIKITANDTIDILVP